MLTISPGADEALTLLRDSIEDLPEGGGVRITVEEDVEEDGSSAFALGVAAAPGEGDQVVGGHPLPIFVDPEAAPLLERMQLEGEVHGDHVHFGFAPQAEEDGPAAA